MKVNLPLNDQQALARFVDRRHPDFDRHIHHWEFCVSTYEGGREWFIANIHPYLKEGTLEYAARIKRAYRFNHTKEVVQLVTKYIFKQGVIRNKKDASTALISFWAQPIQDGSPIDVLMQRISNWSSINGRVWVVVDNKAPQGMISKADEKNGQTRIYAYCIKQQDMLDFSRDEWGKLRWVLYRMPYRDDEDPLKVKVGISPRYMLWTREEWFLLEDHYVVQDPATTLVVDQSNNPIVQTVAAGAATAALNTSPIQNRKITLIDSGKNNLGEVPVFAVDHIESEMMYAPPGLIDDIAYLDRACANYLTNLDAIIQDQTFSQLAMPAQGLMPGEESYNKMLEMGTKRIFLYDGESQRPPEYLCPDASQAQLIISTIRMIIGEIYHTIGMAGERTKQDNAMGIDNSSGVAKAYDFDRMNALLCAKAQMLQRAEERLSYLVRRWAGEIQEAQGDIPAEDKTVDSLIKYPDDYDVRGLLDEFEIADNLSLLAAPDGVRRQQMTSLVDKLFPRLAKDLKDQLMSEMKQWPVDPAEAAQSTLSSINKLGNTISKFQQNGGLAKPGGATPEGSPSPSESTQGQNPGKPKTIRDQSK